MGQHNYTCSITANISTREALNNVTRVSEWWSENIRGSFKKPGDVFTIHFAFGDSFVIRIVEVVPDTRIQWLVTDCNLTWVKDSKEWKGTRIRFDISTENNATHITFTHIGLVPQIECYTGCVKGWNEYIKGSLLGLLTEGKGKPDRKIEAMGDRQLHGVSTSKGSAGNNSLITE